jgi:hypothetical protein
MEQWRKEWQRAQREIQQARAAPRDRERGGQAARVLPHQQVVYRGAQAVPFVDREGKDAERARVEAVVVVETDAAPRPAPQASRPAARPLSRLLQSPAALRQAFILSEIIGPPKALRPPDERG